MIVYFNKCLDIANMLQSKTKQMISLQLVPQCIFEMNAGLKSVVLELLSKRGSKANE